MPLFTEALLRDLGLGTWKPRPSRSVLSSSSLELEFSSVRIPFGRLSPSLNGEGALRNLIKINSSLMQWCNLHIWNCKLTWAVEQVAMFHAFALSFLPSTWHPKCAYRWLSPVSDMHGRSPTKAGWSDVDRARRYCDSTAPSHRQFAPIAYDPRGWLDMVPCPWLAFSLDHRQDSQTRDCRSWRSCARVATFDCLD